MKMSMLALTSLVLFVLNFLATPASALSPLCNSRPRINVTSSIAEPDDDGYDEERCDRRSCWMQVETGKSQSDLASEVNGFRYQLDDVPADAIVCNAHLTLTASQDGSPNSDTRCDIEFGAPPTDSPQMIDTDSDLIGSQALMSTTVQWTFRYGPGQYRQDMSLRTSDLAPVLAAYIGRGSYVVGDAITLVSRPSGGFGSARIRKYARNDDPSDEHAVLFLSWVLSETYCNGTVSEYGDCNVTCGGGMQTRSFEVSSPSIRAACADTLLSRSCNTQACTPVTPAPPDDDSADASDGTSNTSTPVASGDTFDTGETSGETSDTEKSGDDGDPNTDGGKSTASTSTQSGDDDDDSSSPLIASLSAVMVLAFVIIGVFLFRKRNSNPSAATKAMQAGPTKQSVQLPVKKKKNKTKRSSKSAKKSKKQRRRSESHSVPPSTTRRISDKGRVDIENQKRVSISHKRASLFKKFAEDEQHKEADRKAEQADCQTTIV